VSSRQDKLQFEAQFKVLREIHANPETTQRHLAEKVGISLGAINYCLSALAEKGYLKVQNFKKSKNKLGYIYLLTPKGIAKKTSMTRDFLKMKLAEYEALKVEIEALKRALGDNGS
jgi:EPS-associated MarR family transcriptional regulator